MAQVGILGTAVVEILIGLLIQRVGKAALDRILPPIITGSVAIVIGIALAGTALSEASANWPVAFITLIVTIVFSVYLQGKGLLGMLPILLGAIVGYLVAIPFGLVNLAPGRAGANGSEFPTSPSRPSPIRGPGQCVISVALIAIATIPESTAHLYQMSLYIDQLAKDLGRKPTSIKNLIGLNLVADGADDIVVGLLGGCAGTNYGENNSLMAITRNYSVPVLIAAGVIAILLGFVGKLAALINTIPVAVIGGLSIYLFGVIGKQGVALHSERAGQPVRSEEPGHRRDDPGAGHRRRDGSEGRSLPVPDPRALPERHPGDRVLGHRRHPAEPAIRPAAAVEVRRQGAEQYRVLGVACDVDVEVAGSRSRDLGRSGTAACQNRRCTMDVHSQPLSGGDDVATL